MATPKSSPTPNAPKNRGNRRSGIVKGSHAGTRRGQMPWRKDPLIRERVELHRTLWMQGQPGWRILQLTNKWLTDRNTVAATEARAKGLPAPPEEPPITLDTCYDDRARIRELWSDHETDTQREHLESLRLVKREAWTAFHAAKGTSLNRSGLLSTIVKAEDSSAKIDGSLKGDGPVNVQITVNQAQVTFGALVAAFDEHGIAEPTRVAVMASMARHLGMGDDELPTDAA